jgi:hypothetical protein
MAGIIWLFLAQVFALVMLSVVLVGLRRRPSGVDAKPQHRSSCKTPMSLRRVPLTKSHALFGEWGCPHCGTRMDNRGRMVGKVT